MRVIHVLRKPVAESSIAANIVEHGTGGLHINAARISTGEQPKPTTAPGWDSFNKTNAEQGYRPADYAQGPAEYVPSPDGRWPGNLVLRHLDECKVVGTKRVKAKQLTAGRRTVRWGVGEGGDTYEKGTGARFATEDGLDSTLEWECAPGCPVAELDKQSGMLSTGGGCRNSGKAKGIYGQFSGKETPRTFDSNTGGASRFFKQVGGKK